jgi:N-carbamoyl-L-amino-acid hydrolase
MHDNIRVDGGRLWSSLMEMAEIGATPKGGVNRISFTDEDRRSRDLFTTWCEAAGLTVKVDKFGNMFARRAGRDPSLPPVMVGSHLDSQPTGGKYDGAYGVLSGLEIARCLNDAGIETLRPIEVVNWTNEEGAILKPMIGSEVFTGALALDDAYAMPTPDGTAQSGLDQIGYKGDLDLWSYPVHCYFESHIEQGPILEDKELQVGVVTGAFAQQWYTVKFTGLEAHAGPTPMASRRDALVGASHLVLAIRDIALDVEGGRGTVGCITPYPASPNVIPGTVDMTVDFRHETEQQLAEMTRRFEAVVKTIAEENRLEVEMVPTVTIDRVPFHPTLVGHVRDAAKTLGVGHMDIVSGAGHDACHMAKVIPTTMVFIPCKDGISHNELESATPEDCEAGCNVMCQAVLAAANSKDPLELTS